MRDILERLEQAGYTDANGQLLTNDRNWHDLRTIIKNHPGYPAVVDDGWIEWNGMSSGSPVPAGTMVEVRFHNVQNTAKGPAGDWKWYWGQENSRPYDIVAYRVIK